MIWDLIGSGLLTLVFIVFRLMYVARIEINEIDSWPVPMDPQKFEQLVERMDRYTSFDRALQLTKWTHKQFFPVIE